MIVRHFMSTAVFTLPPDRHCVDALHDLRTHRIRRAPVVEGGKLVGIVSERRLLSILPGTPEQADTTAGQHGMNAPVHQVMTAPVITAEQNEHLESAAKKMIDHHVSGLPVVDGDRIVGMLTESDLFRVLARILSAEGENRLLLATDPGRNADVAAVCVSHQAAITTLVRCTIDGRELVDVGLRQAPDAKLIESLWKQGLRVVQVERG